MENPLRDPQDAEPRARCVICDAELFEYEDGPLCPTCREKEEEN